jgi:glyoxylase-like metal-dependent hydrolase (beta-lactamase superfamily II)
MGRLPRLVFCLCLITLFIVVGTAAQKGTSWSAANYKRGREIVDAAIKAMGGLESLQTIRDITREMSGVRTDEGQGLRPVPHNPDYYLNISPPLTNRPRQKSVRDLRGQRVSDELEDTIVGGQPVRFRTVLTPKASFTINYELEAVRLNPAASIGPARTALFRRYPESLLPTVWNRPEATRWLGESTYGGRKQQVLGFSNSDGATFSLFFDTETHLLTKSEALGDNPVFGDVSFETVYEDYRTVDKVVLPFRYVDKVAGVVLQDMRASSILLNTNPSDEIFEMPKGFVTYEPLPPTPNVVKLAEGVYEIRGPYNSIFVVFNDYVLVLEAGFANGYSRASINRIKEIAPGKPIRYLVSTHFHYDHLGGVRSYIAEGTTIVTTAGAKQIIESIVAPYPHVMRPDALARAPRQPTVETVSKKRVFDDGVHRVELYDISPSPHCAEMIIAYLPKQKILFEGDLLDLEVEGRVGTGGDDTKHLAEQIEQLGLDVEKIVPVHGHIGSMEDLRKAVAKWAAQKQKTPR